MCDMVLDDGMKAAAEMGAWVKGSMDGKDVWRKNSSFYKRFGMEFHEWNDCEEGRAERIGRAMEGWSDDEFSCVDLVRGRGVG